MTGIALLRQRQTQTIVNIPLGVCTALRLIKSILVPKQALAGFPDAVRTSERRRRERPSATAPTVDLQKSRAGVARNEMGDSFPVPL